jgi:transposase InsO family protein
MLAKKLADFRDDGADWVSVPDAAALLGVSIRQVRRIAQAEAPRGRARLVRPEGGGKSVWQLHRTVNPRLAARSEETIRKTLETVTLRQRFDWEAADAAYEKAAWVRKLEDAWATDRRRTRNEIAADIARRAKVGTRTLLRWRADHQRGGIETLIDGRSCAKARTEDGSTPNRSPEATALFWELFRVRSQPSVTTCHAIVLREAEKNGWAWPKTVQSTHAWMKDADRDPSLTYLLREGKSAWSRRYMSWIEQDDSKIEPGEFYVADHHECDFWVTDGRTQFRPWLTAFLDMKSRMIVGWHIGRAPHQDAIARAMLRAFRAAVPLCLRIDNGKDFASELLTGITKTERRALQRELGKEWRALERRNANLVTCDDPRWNGILPELGVEVKFATPYAPWAKGRVERFFGTMEGQFGKSIETYCGYDALRKPEYVRDLLAGHTKEQRRAWKKKYGKRWRGLVPKLADRSAVPTLETIRERFATWLDVYHNSEHVFEGERKQVPQAIWKTARSLRKADPAALECLMQCRGDYVVNGNGVRLKVGNRTLGYGQEQVSLALRPYVGKRVRITMDPDACGVVNAWTLERPSRWIGELKCNQRIPVLIDIDQLREVVSERIRERQTMVRASKAQSRRHLDIGERARRIVSPPAPAAGEGTTLQPVQSSFEAPPKGVQKADAKRESHSEMQMRIINSALQNYCPPDAEALADLFDPANDEEWNRIKKNMANG